MNSRNSSIRSKITALVVVPIAAVLALWTFATAVTVGPALQLLSSRALLDHIGRPADQLLEQLQRERRSSVAFLASPLTGRNGLYLQRDSTDQAVAAFRVSGGSDEARNTTAGEMRERLDDVFAALDTLETGRAAVDEQGATADTAMRVYATIIDTLFSMFAATASFNDPVVDRQIRAVGLLGQSIEQLSRVDALLVGAYGAQAFTAPGHLGLVQALGLEQWALAKGLADLPQAQRVAYQQLSLAPMMVQLRAMESALVSRSVVGRPVPVPGDRWQPTFDASTQLLNGFKIGAIQYIDAQTVPAAYDILLVPSIAALAGLLAFVASVLVSLRVGRNLVRRLAGLQTVAQEMADDRLPSVVRRLRAGEKIDVEAETRVPEFGTDEIGAVGRAFSRVQESAIRSAVQETTARRGLSEVFQNIARRSQTLVHRQLVLLDAMEQRITDPKDLEDLFGIDHLATRMRRHAEDLVILAGATPERSLREPVAMFDVVRAAVSEVEDYQRIHVDGVEPAAVVGAAVGDVVHLLAELLENAGRFSKRNTDVQVMGQPVGTGYALDIEDRGRGMDPADVVAANRKLSEAADLDLEDSARLGHFVVAQLARRHGVQVSLKASPYGGMVAVVLLPAALIVGPAAELEEEGLPQLR